MMRIMKKGRIFGWMVGLMLSGWLLGIATAQSAMDHFDRSVDLKRFRKGNIGWDTQELIASGMKALHEDHMEILKELKALRADLARIEGKR
jgi:hypothetical protein